MVQGCGIVELDYVRRLTLRFLFDAIARGEVQIEPVIATMQRGLRVHPDGTIWVMTTRGTRDREPGVMATFDVFSPEGEFVRQMVVHGEGDPRHDGVFLLANDRAVIVKGFVDAGLVQFTGGRLTVDLGDEEALMELSYCRVRR